MIDRYRVERVLGEGAMSVVYRVRHTELETLHALKLLTHAQDTEWRTRMLQEGRRQAALDHPNVVRVTDIVFVYDVPALVMDYIDGGTLQDLLQEGRPDDAQAERLFLAILDAVEHAHDHGLVHRDLKPANILISRTERGPVPHLADFGLAKPWGEAGAHGFTLAGTPMGTPQYMAPEQIRDAKHVDRRADVFALGCILYELVCGGPAFDGADVPAIFRAIEGGAYRAPEGVRVDVPGRYIRAIAGCLHPDPDERLQSCAEVRKVVLDRPAPTLPSPASTRPTLVPTTLPTPLLAATTPPAPLRPQSFRPAWVALLGIAVFGGTMALSSIATREAAALAETAQPTAQTDAVGIETAPPVEEPKARSTGGPSRSADRICGGEAGRSLGYARAKGPFPRRAGATWTPGRDRTIYAEPPNARGEAPGEPVCVLPPGARVELRQDPVRVPGEGFWVAVDAGAIQR